MPNWEEDQHIKQLIEVVKDVDQRLSKLAEADAEYYEKALKRLAALENRQAAVIRRLKAVEKTVDSLRNGE